MGIQTPAYVQRIICFVVCHRLLPSLPTLVSPRPERRHRAQKTSSPYTLQARLVPRTQTAEGDPRTFFPNVAAGNDPRFFSPSAAVPPAVPVRLARHRPPPPPLLHLPRGGFPQGRRLSSPLRNARRRGESVSRSYPARSPSSSPAGVRRKKTKPKKKR